MKQSIQLRLGQHLTMTPQLQQAIRLLQLSTLELQTEIQQALETNPLLEIAEDEDGAPEGEARAEGAEAVESEAKAHTSEQELNTADDAIPDDLPVDSVWEDIYDAGPTYSEAPEPDSRELDFSGRGGESLQDHLNWQLDLTPFSDTDRAVAEAIVDAVNDDGYLSLSLEEIHEGLVDELEGLELDEAEAVLHRVQQFDPPGVAARDPRECLLIQMRQFDPATPWLAEAMALVGEHLDLLGNRDYNQLMRQMKLSQDDLRLVVELIQSLNPRPGSLIEGPPPEYVVPDVFVRKVKGAWRVELNPDAMPRLRVNPLYAGMVRRADNSADNTYIKNHLQEARWFLKSLQSRSETLLKVATCIVERQRAFFEEGEEAMKPLVLRDIAEAVEMHESTISRVTTQKYMHTPRGIFEFKYFFSSHVGTADGGECSATAIRAMIKKLIAVEEPRKPLSDSKIAEHLLKQGINVARRTVAKYREAMAIPPSNERKRLA